jgi:hypothetical protein
MMPARTSLRFALAMIAIIALGACQGGQGEPDDDTPTDSGQAEPAEPGNDAGEGTDMTQYNPQAADLNAAVDVAIQDLSERNRVSPEVISVVEARAATWPNGALGCPEEGMMYTQALVKGFYILLSDGEGRYAYHAGSDGEPFFCPAKRSQRPPADDDHSQA